MPRRSTFRAARPPLLTAGADEAHHNRGTAHRPLRDVRRLLLHVEFRPATHLVSNSCSLAGGRPSVLSRRPGSRDNAVMAGVWRCRLWLVAVIRP